MAKHHGMKHEGKDEKGKCRERGGSAKPQVVSGNRDVLEEAEEDKTGDYDAPDEHKKGGKVKKKKEHRATGGKVLGLMTGGSVRPRLDRPGRKAGGGIGANTSPLSTAKRVISAGTGSSSPTDSYGGTPKD